jgi:hypothetical protein
MSIRHWICDIARCVLLTCVSLSLLSLFNSVISSNLFMHVDVAPLFVVVVLDPHRIVKSFQHQVGFLKVHLQHMYTRVVLLREIDSAQIVTKHIFSAPYWSH